jgi:hypothetical protein
MSNYLLFGYVTSPEKILSWIIKKFVFRSIELTPKAHYLFFALQNGSSQPFKLWWRFTREITVSPDFHKALLAKGQDLHQAFARHLSNS